MTTTIPALTDKSEPDPFAAIAAELRRAADDIEKLVGSGHPKPAHVALDFHAGRRSYATRDDNETAAAVDALGRVLLGKPGVVQKMGGGTYHYGTEQTTRGPIKVHVYDSVSTPWAEGRESASALAAKEAELEKLRAEVAELRAVAGDERCPDCGESLREIGLGTLGHIPGEICAPADEVSEHYETSGWTGGVDGSGVACACGTTFDGFDSLAEAGEQLKHHIQNPDPVTVYFSFGHGQTDPTTGEKLLDKYVTVTGPSYAACRKAMFASRYGERWSFDYIAGTPTADEWIPQWTEHDRIDATPPATDLH
jgi:hypothetical protein